MPSAPAAGQALAVLGLLSRHTQPLPAASIARQLGLARSSTYHLLAVLQEHGFVVHLQEERRYGLGVAAFELGSAYSRQAPLQRLARPLLTRLVDETRHNAHFAVLHGSDVLYLVEERAPRRPSLVTDVGVRLPAHLAASGLAMLAALPAAQVRALFPSRAAFVQRHGVGPATPGQLRSVLTATRTRGYAVEHGTVTPDLGSVASAVLDHGGHPVAASALTYEDERIDPSTEAELAHATMTSALALSRRIGGVRGVTPARSAHLPPG
ncbi:MAG: IclR family transcriptional regulator [Actinomycetota bacterium]|nr:IclR family transcriptional regulator [Actinomycetota bacterium]